MNKREKLRRLLHMCTTRQQDVFNRMYKNIDNVQPQQLDWAIKQCERTIVNNTEGGKHDSIESFFN